MNVFVGIAIFMAGAFFGVFMMALMVACGDRRDD